MAERVASLATAAGMVKEGAVEVAQPSRPRPSSTPGVASAVVATAVLPVVVGRVVGQVLTCARSPAARAACPPRPVSASTRNLHQYRFPARHSTYSKKNLFLRENARAGRGHVADADDAYAADEGDGDGGYAQPTRWRHRWTAYSEGKAHMPPGCSSQSLQA